MSKFRGDKMIPRPMGLLKARNGSVMGTASQVIGRNLNSLLVTRRKCIAVGYGTGNQVEHGTASRLALYRSGVGSTVRVVAEVTIGLQEPQSNTPSEVELEVFSVSGDIYAAAGGSSGTSRGTDSVKRARDEDAAGISTFPYLPILMTHRLAVDISDHTDEDLIIELARSNNVGLWSFVVYEECDYELDTTDTVVDEGALQVGKVATETAESGLIAVSNKILTRNTGTLMYLYRHVGGSGNFTTTNTTYRKAHDGTTAIGSVTSTDEVYKINLSERAFRGDSEVQCRFTALLSAVGGGTAEAGLYDITDFSSPVAEVDTTSASLVWRSVDFTLPAAEDTYAFAIKRTGLGTSMNLRTAMLEQVDLR